MRGTFEVLRQVFGQKPRVFRVTHTVFAADPPWVRLRHLDNCKDCQSEQISCKEPPTHKVEALFWTSSLRLCRGEGLQAAFPLAMEMLSHLGV